MFAFLLTSLLSGQSPEPAPVPTPVPAKPAEAPVAPPAVVEAWDDKVAKAAADDLTKLLKGTPTMAEKTTALERLATGSNKLLLKPLVLVVEADKSVVVRKRAAQLIANQPVADANTSLRRLLKNPRIMTQPAVLAEVVRGLSRCGYTSQQWSEIDDLFERDYATERVPVHEAILDLVTAQKERQALPLLLRNLDEPGPESVADGSNPPAAYWEARWKSWSAWKGKVKEALFAVTGQRFSTAAEAKEWLKKNPLK